MIDVPNYYLTQKTSELRTREQTQRAELQHRLREAGVDRRGWGTLWACKVLSGLGGLLVALGSRMKRLSGPAAELAKRAPRPSGAWQAGSALR